MAVSLVGFSNLGMEDLNAADLRLLRTINRRLNTAVELEEMLQNVVEGAASLSRAPSAVLALREKGRRELIVRACFGGPVPRQHCPGGQGHGRSAVVARPDNAPPDSAAPRGDVIDLAAARADGYLIAPLVNDGRVIGQLAVAPRVGEPFGDYDEVLLGAFVEDAVLAVARAECRGQLQAQLRELAALAEIDKEPRIAARLRELQEITHDRRAAQRRAATIHSEVLRLLLDGRGLQAAVPALADILNNPVLVQDRVFRVIAHSFRQGRVDEHRKEIILTGETPRAIFEEQGIRERFQELAKHRRPLRLPPFPKFGMQESTLVAPIVFEGDIQGYVSVIESNRRLEEADIVTVEHAVAILAMELLRQKTAFDVESRLRGSFLDELVSGTYPSEEAALRRATALGHDLARPHQLLLVDVAASTLSEEVEKGTLESTKGVLEQCSRLVHELVARVAAGAIAIAKGDNIVVAVPTPRGRAGGKTNAFAVEVATAIKREIGHYLPDLAVSIGIGHECQRVADYRQSYEEARQAVDLLACLGRQGEIISFDALGIYGLLLGSENQAKLRHFAEGLLGPMIEYDVKHQAELLHTLEVFLREGGNLQHAADALYVHVNTARYRLQRIEEICAVDLHDVEARFNLQMALKILPATGRYTKQSTGHAGTNA